MLVAMSRIAIIGGGNIGEALISGLLRAGRQAKDIVVSEKVPARARALADAYSIRISEVADAVEGADFIVVAVKPSDVESATTEIAAALAKLDAEGSERETEQVLVSVAAGVSTGFFESKLAAGAPVVRVMPNAPMLVGAGVSALAKGRFANDEQLSAVAELLESVGTVITVAESQMDTVTAISGSGPAYFFLLVEALVTRGWPRASPAPSQPIWSSKPWPDPPRCSWSGPNRTRIAPPDCRPAPRSIRPPPSYARRLPRRAVLPPLRCVNWNAEVCGQASTRPWMPQKHAPSSSESHQSNLTKS
ncbi:Probable pyrroline-5-carboxylate reductase ProC [Mycobacteroides abscessus]|nr:Probable pyrroline-5-carboxylate reductase ProC [Mycobacteroides abscessus]